MATETFFQPREGGSYVGYVCDPGLPFHVQPLVWEMFGWCTWESRQQWPVLSLKMMDCCPLSRSLRLLSSLEMFPWCFSVWWSLLFMRSKKPQTGGQTDSDLPPPTTPPPPQKAHPITTTNLFVCVWGGGGGGVNKRISLSNRHHTHMHALQLTRRWKNRVIVKINKEGS